MQNVVSVEVDRETSQAIVYQRENGQVHAHAIPFRPWLVSTFRAGGSGVTVKRLEGEGQIRWFHSFSNLEGFEEGRHRHPWGKALVWDDYRQQFLGLNPEYKLFQEMRFEELGRFVFDIEATGLDPKHNRVLMVAVACDLGTFDIVADSEREMIEQLEMWIHACNPDTIEGYNIFGYDIPFLAERASVYGMTLNWGRDYSAIELGKKWNFRVGSYERPVQSWNCHGRHIIDGMMVAMRYDANTQGSFEAFGLKYLTKKLGISKEDRVYIDTANIVELWDTQRDRVRQYALQDAEETRELISMMVQPEFYLCTMIPDMFQNILLSGNAMKINSLLVGEYLNEQWSIPIPPGERGEYAGGAVDCRLTGVFRSVAKADVASLYPSIMLSVPDARPANDELGVFHRTLSGLTKKRLSIKHQEQTTQDEARKTYLHGLNWAYKILINSFYGYLAVGLHFSDFEAAAKVTQVGRQIVNDMADQVEGMGLTVIEIDTDGIYFQFPEGFPVASIPDYLEMHDWVTVEVEDIYDTMISVKAKNYVLKKPGSNKITYHGNSLRSRRDEKFGKQFLESIIACLLGDRCGDIPDIYHRYQERIMLHDFGAEDLCKRERISNKTFTSSAKAKLRTAIKGTPLKEGDYAYIYVANGGDYKLRDRYSAGDADRAHYLGRLHSVGDRLSTVLEGLGINLKKVYKKDFDAWREALGETVEKPKRGKKAKEVLE